MKRTEKYGTKPKVIWHFRSDNIPFSRESFKDTRIQDAIIETCLSYLEERFIETEILKCADKGVGVIVLDRKDYLKEANTQLKDEEVYVEVPMTRLHL